MLQPIDITSAAIKRDIRRFPVRAIRDLGGDLKERTSGGGTKKDAKYPPAATVRRLTWSAIGVQNRVITEDSQFT
jgi:hypothetical protein